MVDKNMDNKPPSLLLLLDLGKAFNLVESQIISWSERKIEDWQWTDTRKILGGGTKTS